MLKKEKKIHRINNQTNTQQGEKQLKKTPTQMCGSMCQSPRHSGHMTHSLMPLCQNTG